MAVSPRLPTVRECQRFHAFVNRVREARGKHAIRYLPFDKAQPSTSYNCLSARSTGLSAGYGGRWRERPYGHEYATLVFADFDELNRVARKLRARTAGYDLVCPGYVNVVTAAFDDLVSREGEELRDRRRALKARLREAGAVR